MTYITVGARLVGGARTCGGDRPFLVEAGGCSTTIHRSKA